MALELLPASYKGFRFLYSSIRTEGGQKVAVHEFPGSSRRSIQDLGQLPDRFVVSAILHGDNYIADVSRFKEILSEGGLGDFIHPSQGTFKVKSTGFTLVEDDRDKGRARFEINFAAASQEVQPIARRSNVGSIAKKSEAVKSALSDRIKTEYNADPSQRGNFTDAVNQLNEISDGFINNSKQFSPNVPGLAEFQREVDDFIKNSKKLIQNPGNLATALFSLFDAFDGIQTTSGNSFRQLSSFFDFGDNDVPNRNNTAGLIQRTNNRNILRTSVQAGSLAEAYREASLIEFQTVPEIDAVSDELDAQYIKIKNQIDGDSRRELSLLRSDVRKLFDDQRLTEPQIIELDLPVLPAIVQAQNLYGDDAQNRVGQLIEVNDTKDTGFLGGRATKVLTV